MLGSRTAMAAGQPELRVATAPVYGLKQGSRYVLLNSRMLLDAPGEYYIDGEAAVLYFIPPALDPSQLEVAQRVGLPAGAFSRRRDCHSAPSPLPLVGVSIWIQRGCHQNDSLADG